MRAEAVDAGQELADLVGVEQALDVALDLDEPTTPEIEILADVPGLERVGRPVVLADRALRRRDQRFGELGPDQVAAVVAQLREATRLRADEGLRGGIFGDEAGGEHAVEATNVAGELGKSEVDQALQLAHPVAEVLPDPVRWRTSSRRLSEASSCSRGGAGRFSSQPRETGCVDCVGLRPLKAGVLEAPRREWVQQRPRQCPAAASTA